jgi:hypothetical protein
MSFEDYDYQSFRTLPAPQDTQACIFLGRAIQQIGEAIFHTWTGSEEQINGVHVAVVRAIKAGELMIYARIVAAVEDRPVPVDPDIRTSEGWTEALKTFQIDVVDRRAWISVANRRRIPQPHWLFVTSESLERFLKPFIATAAADNRAIKHLADMLKHDRDLGREAGWQACKQFGITMAGFRTRIWPKAREKAGLPALARAGRKKVTAKSAKLIG